MAAMTAAVTVITRTSHFGSRPSFQNWNRLQQHKIGNAIEKNSIPWENEKTGGRSAKAWIGSTWRHANGLHSCRRKRWTGRFPKPSNAAETDTDGSVTGKCSGESSEDGSVSEPGTAATAKVDSSKVVETFDLGASQTLAAHAASHNFPMHVRQCGARSRSELAAAKARSDHAAEQEAQHRLD